MVGSVPPRRAPAIAVDPSSSGARLRHARELRKGHHERRERETPPHEPGKRPWAWWHNEARRPQYLEHSCFLAKQKSRSG